ncbi:MAG TPA: hypothetical protein VGC42_12440 [Kofleriaceae bacterium]
MWESHLAAEFAHKDSDEALGTMTAHPRVTIIPTMIGGQGLEELRTFYARHFLNQLPPDIEVVPISRTIGDTRIVDELVIRFTHSIQMDWVLPAIPPTHKRIEFAMVVVVQTEGDKIAYENLYWDNASILRQAGLLPDDKLPVLGAEHARNLIEPAPLNQLIKRAAQ